MSTAFIDTLTPSMARPCRNSPLRSNVGQAGWGPSMIPVFRFRTHHIVQLRRWVLYGQPCRMGRCPFESLHASHGRSHHRIDPFHPQVIDERLLDVYKITYGERREGHAIGFSGIRICRGGAGADSHTILDIGLASPSKLMTKNLLVSSGRPGPIILSNSQENDPPPCICRQHERSAKEGGYQDGIVAVWVELSVVS